MPSSSEQRAKIAYTTITLLGLAYAFYRGYLFWLPSRLSGFDHWQVGDWLIDYSGGMVRRGLSGEFFFTLAPDGATAITFVVVMQVALAATVYVLAAVLYLRTDRGPVWMMLVLSPAFLLFPALDATGNTRKEWLVLVALAIAALAIRSARPALGLWLALPLFTVGVLVHEALIVLLPAFAYLAFVSLPRERARVLLGAYLIPVVISVGIALLRPGSSELAAEICANWRARGIEDCGGALAAIGMPATEMVDKLVNESFPGYWAYLLPAALAALPFFALRFFPRERLIGLLVVAAVAPLFILGWDYGRWVFLIVAQLSFIALALPERSRPMRVPLYGALAFILLWGFNHAGPALTDGLAVRWLSSVLS